MPGIVGLITKQPHEWAQQELQKMVGALNQQPFYSMGTWTDKALGIYVGWSVAKESFADQVPAWNERGDVCVVFSGEDFSERRTALDRGRLGHGSGCSHLSYLVHLYEEDANFPGCLNGRFHGLLTDQGRKLAVLFNDRYGMHRVYYHESKEAFYFSGEAKAILAVRPEVRRLNPRGLGELVACGCVLENRTVFDGVHVLPPASAWVVRDGSVTRKSSYFSPQEWEQQSQLEPEPYHQQIRDVFARNLPLYFNGRERIGMSLTGGLDTRLIMAWQKSAAKSLPCYTFGGVFRDCQDVLIAQQVARACGQSHEIILVGHEFLARFPYYAERAVYLTDGCAAVHHSADLYVNEKAREIAPVRMTGNYGDEILRRVRVFKPVEPLHDLFRPELLTYVQHAKATYADVTDAHPLSFAAFRQAPWHHYGLLALEQTQLTVRTPYLDNELVRNVFRGPESSFASNELRLQLIGDGNVGLRRMRTDLGFGGEGAPLVGEVTRRLLKFTFKAEYAYDYGMPQWLARIDHALSLFRLERLFLGRHKFYHFRVWYRDALSNYVREMLLDQRTLSRPYLQRKTVEGMVNSHLKGNGNYTAAIHKVLTLELLHRLFIDAR